MDRIDPIAPDRTVPRVDLAYLTPLEREREDERRERERRRRQEASQTPPNRRDRPDSGIDVRA